jgi:predicted  nucleic acid-binding Zn-ribbon protein
MEAKAKVLIIGLILLLAVSLFSLFYVASSKEMLKQEYEAARQRFDSERIGLKKKADSAMEERNAAVNRMEVLQKDLDRLARENADIQKKYTLLSSEKDELITELKKKKETVSSVPASAAATPVVDDAYWAAVLKDKASLEVQTNNLKDQVNNLKLSIEDMKKDKSNMDFEISTFMREKQDLERKLIYNERINDSLSAELVREKKDRIELANQLKALNNEYTTVVRQLKTLNSQKVDLDNKMAQAQQDKMALQARINDLEAKIQSRSVDQEEEYLSQASSQAARAAAPAATVVKESVELPPIIVRSTEAPESKPAAYGGKVIAVNRDNNFIVVDLGEEKGMRPGLRLGVYHNNNRIGTVEVVQTRRLISACDIKEEASSISVGDEVR